MNTNVMPDDLRRILDFLDANEREAQRLAGALSAAQLTWQPGNGAAWSLCQCLAHLIQTNEIYSEVVEQAVASADPVTMARVGPVRPGWFGRRFLGSLEPPVRLKVTAPGKLKPASQPDPSNVLSRFLASHDTLRSVIRDAVALDLNRICFPNPFFSKLSMSAGLALLLIPAHERRHLWQMKNVRAQREFPTRSAL